MFNLTPEDLANEIVSRFTDASLSAISAALTTLKVLPALHKEISTLPGHLFTGDELNSTTTELPTVYNRTIRI